MTDETITSEKLGELEAIAQELQKQPKEESTQVRTTASDRLESWDNDRFRERVREILLTAQVRDVDVDKIQIPAQGLAKFQFRRKTAPDGLNESVKVNGVLEPILLQKVMTDDQELFYVVNGHRRFAAWQLAFAEVPSLQKPVFLVLDSIDLPDALAMQLAAELNMSSQNLNEEDAAALIIRLFEDGKMRQADIAALLRKSKQNVSDVIGAFRNVPGEARALIESGDWVVNHGRQLARLKDYPDEQKRLFKQAVATKYNAELMEEKVDSALAKLRWQKQAESKLKAAPPETKTIGEEMKTLTSGQVDKIHKEIVKDSTEFSRRGYSGSEKRVARVGKGEYEPTVAATTKILKKMGYEVVEGEAPKVTEKKELPKMPSDIILMEESEWRKSICPFCKGRTHPVVAEELGFETAPSYGGANPGIAHEMCTTLDQIKRLKNDLNKQEQRLEKDELYRLIQAHKTTLEETNNKSHALYKGELERRKQAWASKHLPKPAVKAATIAEEPEEREPPIEKKTIDAILKRLKKEQPDLVPADHDYWDAFRRYNLQEPGWESQRKAAKSMGLSYPSVFRQFGKLQKAIADLQ
jgi:ParB/RepB/Spo0J family partition protein